MKSLYVDSLIKSFYTKQILTDVYITCNKGDIIGLLGRNGSGKSTLMKIIFGSLRADSKFVKVGDRMVNGLFDNRKLITYLPQHNFLPSHVKVNSIIDIFCTKKNAGLLKNNYLIKPMLRKKIRQLSSGEKRLLEILLIVLSDSKYTLIDEPFNGISPIYKEDIKSIIREQSTNKGFIITDHDYRSIMDIATRIVIIRDGGTKEIKNKDELICLGYIPENV